MKYALSIILLFFVFPVLSQTGENDEVCKYVVVKNILKLNYEEYFSLIDKDANLENAYSLLDSIVLGAKEEIENFEKDELNGVSINKYTQQLLLENNSAEIRLIVRNFLIQIQQEYLDEKFNVSVDFSRTNNLFFHFFTGDSKNRKADCDTYSYILYAIALEYDLPIFPVLTDKHVFIIWQLNENKDIKYETLYSNVSIRYTANTSQHNFLILDTDKKIETVTYNNIATMWFYESDYENYREYCLKYYEKTKELMKQNNIKSNYLTNNLQEIIDHLPEKQLE